MTEIISVNISIPYKHYGDIMKIEKDEGVCIAFDTKSIKEATKLIVIDTSSFAETFQTIEQKHPDFTIWFYEVKEQNIRMLICQETKSAYSHILLK